MLCGNQEGLMPLYEQDSFALFLPTKTTEASKFKEITVKFESGF